MSKNKICVDNEATCGRRWSFPHFFRMMSEKAKQLGGEGGRREKLISGEGMREDSSNRREGEGGV